MIEMQKLLEERKAKYANAQIQIDTTGSSADDVVNAIIREVQERNGNEESK